MGILDSLTNLSPDQTQGLLAAAAQMLQASGPSRMPTSFGQVLGTGLQGYQTGLSAAQEERQKKAIMEQAQALNSFKLMDAQSDFQKQEAERKRAEQLRQFYMQDGQAPAAKMGGEVFAQAAQAAGMPGDDASLNKIVAGVNQGMSPQQAATSASGAMPAAPAGQNQGIYQQRMAMAQRLRSAGFNSEADAQEAAALKFQPKVKGWEKVQQGGKVMFAPFFEDGTSGQPVPLEVAEKLEFKSTGKETLGLNPFTGAKVASYTNTASPDAQLTAQTAGARLQFDKSQVGKPIFNADAGGFVYAPNKANPNGAFQALPGFDKGKAPTEFQGKSAAFALRAGEANKTIGELTGNYSPAAINSKQSVENTWLVGGALGAATNKFALSEKDQKAEQAQRDFVNAVLRQESGAAIGASEFDNAKKQYFPQPGDTAGVIEQKARNRALAVQALTSNAGRAALTAPPRAAASNGWSIKKVGE